MVWQVVVVVAAMVALVGCSPTANDDPADAETRPTKKSKQPTEQVTLGAPATTEEFCREFRRGGGSETDLRPVPVDQPAGIVNEELERALSAMEDLRVPLQIADAWAELLGHYRAMATEFGDLSGGESLSEERIEALAPVAEETFDRAGAPVVNFVLQQCS